MLDYHVCKNWCFDDIEVRYSERDTMLYALGLGYGEDPLNLGQLRFVLEPELQAMPTMACVMGSPGIWWTDSRTGANAVRMVHGEQDVRWLGILPVAGVLVARNRVISLTDKGAGKGAVAVVHRELFDKASGAKLVESRNISFLRGDGGFSEAGGVSDPAPEPLPPLPRRPPDLEISLATLPQAALIYRLSGDYNPLHADPTFATGAGFERPILHGLCTYGMAARAVLSSVLDNVPARLRRLAARFTAPVYPGEAVRYEIWCESAAQLRIRGSVDARNMVVLDRGVAEIAT